MMITRWLEIELSFVHLRAASNWPLRAKVGQKTAAASKWPLRATWALLF